MAASSLTIKDYRTEIPGGLSEDKKFWIFPTLQTINNRTGSALNWRLMVGLFVSNDNKLAVDDFIEINDSYFDSQSELPAGAKGWIKVLKFYEGKSPQKSDPTIIFEGMNLGKANQTNIFTQSLRDALSMFNKHKKKERTDATDLYFPMLAQSLKEQTKQPDFSVGVFVQRKLDGVRVVSTKNDEGKVILYSRKKKEYPGFQNIRDELLQIFDAEWMKNKLREFGNNAQLFLDGELYLHGLPLQTISGIARKEDKEQALEYHLYDCFIPQIPQMTFSQRNDLLQFIVANLAQHEIHLQQIKFVETFYVHSWEEVDALYNQFIEEKYEGAMVRLNEPYEYSYNEKHSKVLLKVKPQPDAEFKIVDFFAAGKGKAAGALMWICETENGKRFNVTPKMPLPERKKMFQELSQIEANGKTKFENEVKGKPLTVEFATLSKLGIPTQPRGIAIRYFD